MTDYIRRDKIAREFNCLPVITEDHLPCYGVRINVPNIAWSKEVIRRYIQQCRLTERKGLLVFSVTERDFQLYEKFLEVCKKYKCATIVETVSRLHGDYKCWMIIFPATGK